MIKHQFISRLMRERDKFELLVNRVGYARRMTLKGVVGKWSVKDILAHIYERVTGRCCHTRDERIHVHCIHS